MAGTRRPLSARGAHWLKMTTSLTGVTAALIVTANPAHATPYHFTPPVLASSTVLERHPQPQPLDLTVRADETNSPSGRSRIARVADGASTILAVQTSLQYGDVVTTADNAPAVSVSEPGDLSISANTVTTSGANSGGLIASADGSINAEVRGAYTTGSGSGGISVVSTNGNVSLDNDWTTTQGKRSIGIYASGHDVTVTSGSIITNGGGSSGLIAIGTGADAVVDLTSMGEVSTYGANSAGIYAKSDGSILIHNQGTVQTVGQAPLFGNNHGFSAGITAQAAGDITIDGGGSVFTGGAFSPGISAYSQSGSITISANEVGTAGDASNAIVASTVAVDPYSGASTVGGDVSVSANTVITGGLGSVGIDARGAGVDVTIAQALTTYGKSAYGVIADAYTGNVGIHNEGTITTTGAYGTGITAIAAGSVVIDGGGSISATGRYSSGIRAQSADGSITIDTGDISAHDAGIIAQAIVPQTPYSYSTGNPANSINITTGQVTTTGSGSAAGGIVATDQNLNGAVTISAKGVSTQGDYAAGIIAYSAGGAVSVTAGTVTTHGEYAHGIEAQGSSIDIDADSVSTSGSHAVGIYVANDKYYSAANTGPIAVTAGTVSTSGDYGTGIATIAFQTSTSINAGSIVTTGDHAAGISARATSQTADQGISIGVGSVSTSGAGAFGIYATAAGAGDVSITQTGTIDTKGASSFGIAAGSLSGNVEINANDVTTAGAAAPA
ncbi:MAG TPA: hypothetical protein VF491_24095, partial [Vicinamibacterales bacterium]